MVINARTLVWLGAALLIAAVAFPSAVVAQVSGQAPAQVAPPPALPKDVAFARFIALIRGHLLTGVELATRRDWDVAARHFSFPTEEVYGVIREDLRAYQVPQFDWQLKALVRVAKAHNAKQYPGALQQVEKALATVEAAIKAKQANWPRFVVAVAVEVLKTAPDEYDDAVVKSRIVRPIGYQTARGFILQSDRMIESVAGEVTSDKAVALADVRAGLSQLKASFANVNPPKQAEVEPAAVSATVSRIETAAATLP